MKGRGKGKIHMSQPELPPFLQRMKEQIVAEENEADELKKQETLKRRSRAATNPLSVFDDDPTVVKIGEDDLTEEDYKRLKEEMETKYKVEENQSDDDDQEFDLTAMVSKQQAKVTTKDQTTKQNKHPSISSAAAAASSASSSSSSSLNNKHCAGRRTPQVKRKRQLNYDSSSSDD